MRKLMKFRSFLIALSVLVIVSLPVESKSFVKPAAQPAKSYTAHDDHTSDKVAIGAEPYDAPDKAKIFSINFAEHGFLPIFFVITNDGDQPISIADMQVTLTTADRDKLTPAVPDDLYRRLSNAHANTHPIPVPIPQKKVKGGLSQQQRDEIETSQFAAKAVEPHTTQSGFLFFDIQGVPRPLLGAHIYITGVDDAKGAELMYFELVMGK